MTDGGKLVSQSLLDEHGNNLAAAFADLSARYERLSFEIHILELKLAASDKKRSWAYSRELAPPTTGVRDDVPNPIDDGWVRTGREA